MIFKLSRKSYILLKFLNFLQYQQPLTIQLGDAPR